MIGADIVAAIRARLTAELAPPACVLRPWRVDGRAVGWLDERRLARALRFSRVFREGDGGLAFARGIADFDARTRALDEVARALAAEGALSAWRDERYAVAPELGASPWFLLERAAARYFGIRTYAAHVNGLVAGGGAWMMWLARRSPAKAIDPGLLDNLVGGGIAAGQSVAATVTKEAWEEAGIAAPLAARAEPTGTVLLCRSQPDGFQRETIYVHDLVLPDDFTPDGQDDETVEHRRVGFDEAARLIAQTSGPGVVTADASLVVLDCLLRRGAIAPDASSRRALVALLRPDCAPYG